MFYAHFIDGEGHKHVNLYHGYSRWFSDTFSPDTVYKAIIDFKVKGKNYREKQEYLRNIAIDFQLADSEANGGLSYFELAEIQEFFAKNGKRFGLMQEFKENAIC